MRYARAVYARRMASGVALKECEASRRLEDALRGDDDAKDGHAFCGFGARRRKKKSVRGAISPKRPMAIVRVRVAGLNPVDAKALYGDKCPPWTRGAILRAIEGRGVGFDFSGEVVACDADAGFAPGDEVFGCAPPCAGSLAQYVEVPVDQMCAKPADMPHRDAAAIGLVGVTVCQTLDHLHVGRSGCPSPVLVIGASGGVGHIATQICTSEGGKVFAVCSSKNVEFVESLAPGVAAIPYDDPNAPLERALVDALERTTPSNNALGEGRRFNLVLDCVTSNLPADFECRYPERIFAADLLAPGARYVTFGGKPTAWAWAHIKRFTGINPPFTRSNCLSWIYFRGCERQLRHLAAEYIAGRVTPTIAEALPFTEAGVVRGFNALRGRRVVGKLVVVIDE